ncbi:MAG: uracil-DNA glycosylase family protein [Pontixanthobacter sp.]
MAQPSNLTLAQEFAAALDWWRDAGIDSNFSDDATDWLAESDAKVAAVNAASQAPTARVKPVAAPPPPEKRIGGDKENWPTSLEQFQIWLRESADVDDGGGFPIVSPRGPHKAKLMIIVGEPEESDREALLSGPQGKLLAGMMRAAAIAPESLYLASVLRRHTPMPDWAALRAAGCGELLTHHIALVAPERILAFGRSIPALLGNDTAQGAAILHDFNHEGGSIPAMGVSSLAELLRSAGRRQRFWHSWLEWTG